MNTESIRRIDKIVAKYGEEYFNDHIVLRIADGDSPTEIAKSLGLTWFSVRKYIEENLKDDVALAYRARADVLEHRGTNAVDTADPESVSVARLKSEYYLKLAERLDKKKYGAKDAQEGGGVMGQLPVFNVTFVGSGEIPHNVVENVPIGICEKE